MFHVIKRGSVYATIEADNVLPVTFASRAEADAYVDQLRAILGAPAVTTMSKRGPKGARIKCHQTGQIFESIKEASAALNVSASAISQHLVTPYRYRTVGRRYTFERVNP